jgi:protein ImuA
MQPNRHSEKIVALRREIAAVALRDHGVLPFGVDAVDRHLPGGGLLRGALHAIGGEDGASLGFVAALAGLLQRLDGGRLVWVSPRPELCGAGLAPFGLRADRMLLVRAPRPADALWALEEALRTPGIVAVVGEARGVDPVAGRRLQLAAQAGGATGFLLLTGETDSVPGAVTRWHVGAALSTSDLPGLGAARWHAELRRCRGADSRSWLMEWTDATDSATGGFAVPADPLDRPHFAPIRIAG